MAEKVKNKCEKCGRELKKDSNAYSCRKSCIFCHVCAKEMNYVCPNCSGKLENNKKKS